MIVRDRVYTIDDVWRLSQLPENEHKFLYLIDGELLFMSRPGGAHGLIASLIAHFLWTYVLERELGRVTTETGYHPPDSRTTLLGPDVGFVHRERAPQPFPARYVPVMPDLAVAVLSPSNSMPELRRKAEDLSAAWHGAGLARESGRQDRRSMALGRREDDQRNSRPRRRS